MTRESFNDYVRQLSRKLYGYAFRILRNQEEAEDAVQEIFIKLWKMEDKLEIYDSIDALATTMIKNYCIDRLRKQKLISSKEDYLQGYLYVTSPTPQEQMESKESDDIIRKLIDKLPDTYKQVINLRDIQGYSYEEIAEKTDQNINTLRVTLSRARVIIRDEYKKYHNEKRGNRQAAR